MRCACCGFETEVVTLYCVRCGEPGVPDESSAEWQHRLGVVRVLIANRVWDPLAGIAAIKRQVERLQAIEQEPFIVPQNLALARRWLARELGPALSEPDLSLRHQLCEMLCEWLPTGEAPQLHAHFQHLRDLIPELQSGAKTAAQGSLPPAAAAAWLDSTAKQYGFSPGELRRCLFATPHYWSRLAKAVDSAAFDEAQYELFLGYGYGAAAKKKLPEAKTNFESAQRLAPERPEAYVGLGAVETARDDRAAALRLYKQALSHGTQNPRVLNDLAWYETTVQSGDERDLDLARSAAQLAVTVAPICHYFDTLAEVLSERGELSAALRAARAAFADSPDEKYRYRIDILAGAESILNPSLGQLPQAKPEVDAFELELPELGRDQGPLLAPDEFAGTDAPSNGKPHSVTPRASLPPASQDSDEDFELTLDDSGGSDDEFELTLDDPDDPLALDDIPPYLADRDPEPAPNDIDLSHLDDEFALDLGPEPAVAVDDDFFLAPATADELDEEVQGFELPPMEEEIALHSEPEVEPEPKPESKKPEIPASGGMGVVFKSPPSKDSSIALKVQRRSEGNLAQFQKEIDALERQVDEEATAKVLARLAATQRGDYSQAPATQRDTVDCAVFAPASVPPATEFLIQAFVYLPQHEAEAATLAKEADRGAARRGRTALGTEIARGSELTFELVCSKAEIDDPVQTLVWRGRTDSVSFGVTAPAAGVLVAKLKVIQDSVPIGQIRLTIVADADLAETPDGKPLGVAKRYRSAFASYASPDRDEVIRRVQMLGAVGIQCFQDVLDLKPGDRWAQKLYKHIDEADVLFLFWSRHARDSQWVAKEWKYALEKHGDEFIQPVILEGPPVAPPPPELAHLHFNDKLAYMLRGAK